ncbi:hypothetical protein DY000_02005355 [Brassica cretica]|uniref:Uncharacterized protein n=1 Tax=Brassica cretica TaxID=69181 RepID=A0ABQ7CK24_BRACR|nr:hypothetical protein DY000_02005355 [Brassica cretica]
MAAEGNHLVAEEGPGHHLAVVVVGVGFFDLKDAYLNVMENLHVEVDDEFKSLLGDIDTPRDLLDVEKELLKIICVTNAL